MKMHMLRRIGVKRRKNSERERLRIHFSETIFWIAIDKDRTVPRRQHLNIRRLRTANRGDECNKATNGEIRTEILIDPFEGCWEILFGTESGSRIGVADRC